MLANSKGQDLIQHLRLVGIVAREMALFAGMDEELQRLCEYAGYAHDLGKAVSWFQKYLKNSNGDEESSDKPLHHEVSWAYLASKFDRYDKYRPIINAVYWHHSRPIDDSGNYFESREQILGELSDGDLKAVDRVAKAFDWSKWFRVKEQVEQESEDEDVPNLFLRDERGGSKLNAQLLAVRTSLISADRYVSALSPEAFSDACSGRLTPEDLLINFKFTRPAVTPISPADYDAKRFDIQVGCSESAFKEKSVIVKAPAGFGKTIVGVLWGLKSNKQFLWVCPRNAVAEAVYRNITRELKAMDLADISVELHLTGERKASVGKREEFCSDIVVTNIDTILRPMVDNRVADRLFIVLASPMVLDEFHEFASDQPLFAAFVTLMRARHRLCSDVKTLLLSATPMVMRQLWDADGQETVYLPNASSHYPAAHKGTYGISMIDGIPTETEPGSLVVVNSVVRAQDLYRTMKMDHILHSRFTDDDRQRIMEAIFTGFGKGGDGVASGRKVVSALVIQAAMDVSFRNLYESICSPEFTLQRIGRCDRWGNFQQDNPQIHIMKVSDRNEDGAIRTVYDPALRKLWLDHLSESLNGKEQITLDNLYQIYNSFYGLHQQDVKAYLKQKYGKGLDSLREYCPIKIKTKGEKNERTKGGRNLRNPFGSYFFSVRTESGNWLGPDDVMDEGPELKSRFKNTELLTQLCGSSVIVHLKALYQAGFLRYRRYIKRRRPPANLDQWFRLARSAETPLPDFSRRYSREIGLYERR